MENKAVEIRNLDYSYPDGTMALQDINLDIYEGETVGVIGPNGAGKTTFLLHLNGLLNGCRGISIFGLGITNKNIKEVRKMVGLVFQDPEDQLFMPTVFEDVAFGPTTMGLSKEDIKASVKKALEAVDMSYAEKRLSHHLSLGEKKRVAIATVLSMSPKVLILDEPTSNLDPKHRRNLINLLKGLKMTKIIATHDLELTLEICSRVVLLDKGRVAASADTAIILSDKPLLEAHNLEVPLSIACKYYRQL